MASRRTRIKGITNIPQRRKTEKTPEEHVKSVPEIAQNQEDGIHNPNLSQKESRVEHALVVDTGIEESPKSRLETNNRINPESDIKINIFTPGAEIINGIAVDNVTDARSAVKNEDPVVVKSVENVEPRRQQPLLARRKFIKPTVSLNAINRKVRDEVEDNKPFAVTDHKPVKSSSKIVILNEVITYANQPNPILIQRNQSSSGSQGNSQNTFRLWMPPTQKSQLAVEPGDIESLVPNPVLISTPELEYPVPPPSPTKVNRSRIKAVPRLGQRHHSFSASESEDESRRNYRHRNDSVCSTASGIPDTASISDCPSPQKPKEFNSVIQRKCRRTEQSRKLAEARREFFLKFGNDKPDRQKLTMIDLIFYNPTTNPMSHEAKIKKDTHADITQKEEEEVKVDELEEESTAGAAENKSGSDEENEMPAPQIKIGPQGEIVLDEQSLVIESKSVKKGREQIQRSEVVNGDFDTGYGVYKRAKRSKDWSKLETLKFYKALNTIGTDFTLMCDLFPRRSRRELKMKFKKEERINKTLIDKAIMQPCGFDFDDFKQEVDMEEKELQEVEKQKEKEIEMRKDAKKRKSSIASPKPEVPEKVVKTEVKIDEKPRKRRKKIKNFDILNVLDDDDSDADESEVDDDFEEDIVMQNLQKPTRSGRVPKILDRYRAPAVRNYNYNRPYNPHPQPKTVNEPGSLMVVASTGPNGEPVYKVFMVTGEQSRQQIGDDVNSLSKAMQLRGIQNIFTLTTSQNASPGKENVAAPIEEHNITIPAEEHNVTIPAEEHNVTIPAEVHNVTIPAEEHSVSIPAEEQNVTIPAEEHNVTIPADEHNVTIPAEEHSVTIPAERQNVTIPVAEYNSSNPTEGVNFTKAEINDSVAEDSHVPVPAETYVIPEIIPDEALCHRNKLNGSIESSVVILDDGGIPLLNHEFIRVGL